jgi:histidinol-phosphate aminotransferase
MIPQYAFIAYKILARGLGLAVKEIPVKNFEVDLDAMLAAITSATRVIILANPNNPTGTYIREEKLKQFLMALPKEVVLVLDEAYYEYVTAKDYPQSIALMEQHPNLVITRTFSKAYGLAGLRLGYGIAHPGLVELINRIRQPFNVNHIAQAAAIFALEDQAFVKQGVQINEQGKTQWYQALSRLGVPFVPSAGNFIMVHLPGKAHAMFQALLQKGIIVRPLDPYGLGDYLRISIGTEAENLAAIDALQKSLIEEKAHDRIT